MTEQEHTKELENILIGLMISLGISKVKTALTLAMIRAYQIHEEMIDWIASFHGKEDTITAQIFMSKLSQLTDGEKE